MYPPCCYFDNITQAMFDLNDQIFEAMCTLSDKRSDKQHVILKYSFDNTLEHKEELNYLREKYDQIFEKQHK